MLEEPGIVEVIVPGADGAVGGVAGVQAVMAGTRDRVVAELRAVVPVLHVRLVKAGDNRADPVESPEVAHGVEARMPDAGAAVAVVPEGIDELEPDECCVGYGIDQVPGDIPFPLFDLSTSPSGCWCSSFRVLLHSFTCITTCLAEQVPTRRENAMRCGFYGDCREAERPSIPA
jgi:hypothetical protein